jgi:hypothetical protein
MLRDYELQSKLDQFVRSLFKTLFPRYRRQLQANERHTDALFRSVVIGKLLSVKDEQVTAEAQQLFSQFRAGKENILPDLRFLVYKSVIQNGGEDECNQVLDL